MRSKNLSFIVKFIETDNDLISTKLFNIIFNKKNGFKLCQNK